MKKAFINENPVKKNNIIYETYATQKTLQTNQSNRKKENQNETKPSNSTAPYVKAEQTELKIKTPTNL